MECCKARGRMPEQISGSDENETQMDTASAIILTFSVVASLTMAVAFFAIKSATSLGLVPLLGISGLVAIPAAVVASYSKTVRELVLAAFNIVLLLAYWS